MRNRWIAIVLFCATLFASSPAWAAFHLMKVVEVFPGTPAAPNAQYVVLQMYSGGQTVVTGHKVTVFDAAGGMIMSFTFTGSVAVGTNQSKILIATPEAAAFFGIAPDLQMTAVIPAAGGKVCFDTIDCVAWGNYAPADTTVGIPFNGDAAPVVLQPNRGLVGGRALRRRLDIAGGAATLENGDDTGNSSNDFVLGTPSPKNNAGAAGTVPPSTCGNNMLQGLERCDDGGIANNDGCSSTCVDEFCGDMVDNNATETCDDGNNTNGDGCDTNCKVTACGNGVVTTGETCDDGNVASGDGCDANCKPTGCGNGVTTTGEACDDGNLTSGDGCDANCTATGCGNGIVTAGEACEPPGQGTCDAQCQIGCNMAIDCADTDPCTTNERCTAQQRCAVDPTPTDDNEPCTTDGCTSSGVVHDPLADGTSCVLPSDPAARSLCVTGTCGVARCGDGFVDANATTPEQCDDGNTVDDDACTNACTTPRCGDSIVQGTEECDDGNLAGEDGCSSSCLTERCGDGTTNATEQCDDGNAMSSDGCSSTCLLERCGDGVEQLGEQCDDGNDASGDGCTACTRDPVCGDGAANGSEACDDGNVADGDGCSSACAVEPDASGGCCGATPPSTAPFAMLLAFVVFGAAVLRPRRRR